MKAVGMLGWEKRRSPSPLSRDYGRIRSIASSRRLWLQSPPSEETLKHYFGYDRFRPGQKEIIETTLQNQDLLAIVPTGGGKSLC
ncbi:hypothetical protein PJF56_04265, partial [Roseofilum sp. BLCC_M91]